MNKCKPFALRNRSNGALYYVECESKDMLKAMIDDGSFQYFIENSPMIQVTYPKGSKFYK